MSDTILDYTLKQYFFIIISYLKPYNCVKTND